MIIRHSMIEAYIMCHRKFHTLYIENKVEKQSSSALAFGTAMHTAIEARLNEGDDPFKTFEVYWNSIQSEHLEYERYSWDDLNKMALDIFLPKFMKNIFPKLSNTLTELKMEAPILDGKHTLQGTADWVGEFDGEFTLGDWKTSATRYYPNKIQRSLQMYIYAWLYKQNYGKLPNALRYTVFIKSERSIQNNLRISLTEELLNDRMKIVEEICKDIVSKEGQPKDCWYPSPSCYCISPKDCFKLYEEKK